MFTTLSPSGMVVEYRTQMAGPSHPPRTRLVRMIQPETGIESEIGIIWPNGKNWGEAGWEFKIWATVFRSSVSMDGQRRTWTEAARDMAAIAADALLHDRGSHEPGPVWPSGTATPAAPAAPAGCDYAVDAAGSGNTDPGGSSATAATRLPTGPITPSTPHARRSSS